MDECVVGHLYSERRDGDELPVDSKVKSLVKQAPNTLHLKIFHIYIFSILPKVEKSHCSTVGRVLYLIINH